MKIGVCIKRVPDTSSPIKLNAENSGIQEEGLKFVISPYDEFGMEEALKVKEQIGDGAEVIAISVGNEKCHEVLRTALAVGCDRAIHINVADADSLGTAKMLSALIKKENIELLFTGKQAVDADNGQVCQMLGELLDRPQLSGVSGFELKDNTTAEVKREVEGGMTQQWKISLPAIIGANKGLNQPRYASLKGIMAAKKKNIETLELADLGLSDDAIAPKVVLKTYSLPPERGEAKILEGEDLSKSVDTLVNLLRNEAKAI